VELLQRWKERTRLRLGVLGGAFDPLHLGHLVAAEEAREQVQLDEVLFMPTGTAPHKPRSAASAEQRYLMTVLATSSHPQFWVSRHEIDNPEVDYTVATLSHLAACLPRAQLFFITGADAALEILTWKDPERVLELCTLVAVGRPGYDLARLRRVNERLPAPEQVRPLDITGVDVSSTVVRQRVAAGRSVRYLVPEAVAQLIERWGLYRGGQGS